MLKSINRYVRNNEYSINIWSNYIDVNNFSDILVLEDNKVALDIQGKKIIIRGKSISIIKLLNNEILLKGEFTSLELGE